MEEDTEKTRLIHKPKAPINHKSLRPQDPINVPTELDDGSRTSETVRNYPPPAQNQAAEPTRLGQPMPGNPMPQDIPVEGNTYYSDLEDDSAKTTLITPTGSPTPDSAMADSASDAASDPPVACLLIIDGAGQGNVLTVGNGHNTIGRGQENRVVIDFGDQSISSVRALSLFYEHRGNKFYVAPGEGSNLAYIGDDAIMEKRELMSGDEVNIGKTTFKFFPFCTPDWTWEKAGNE